MIVIQIQKKLQSATGEMLLNLDFEIRENEFVTLYGASGSGKTTTLRMISGLTQADKGIITVNNENWLDTNKKNQLPPQKRNIAYVFQDYALFPNMSVRENLNYALEKGQDKSIVEELLALMELQHLQHQKPAQLSGGQKQRVALARALVRRPKILLLDEPLSAVDQEMRIKLQDYILQAHRKYQLTTILVSHDIAEIYKMSDKVIVLENGIISKNGSPDEVFSSRLASGKFQFVGEILKIEKENFINIVVVLIGNNIVKIIAMDEEIQDLNIGNKVLIASKAFNPILTKIDSVPKSRDL
ncbi:molybdenum ABC transporter ATP-binding protein [Flavobacterium sp. L1I52]|uniref:Molybdenum ABC transporter ATP-binding protein n=1 Tax=Flavobacterium pokkalii TaxID=1940408 RepID=A0ABR7UM09_9FLAO|nr:ATP-binding cassette domain-containing protein [Flavobacterium pokkalii]MBD0723917.1 molybdenum ABC transporter ATP-binding protein [Flavobacterium pokkalii]